MRIEKWVYGGDALSRLGGRVLFVPLVLPGEVARVELGAEKSDLARGRAVELVERSPQRVEPPCPYFGHCGGCHYQHASYEFQTQAKREILREQLRRVGKIDFSGEIGILAGPPLGYRNRSQFHLDRKRIGYLERGSHSLVPVEECPISSPGVNRALAGLNEMLGDERFPGFVRSIELFSNEMEVQLNVLETDRPVARYFFEWCAERIPGAASGSLDCQTKDAAFRVSHNSFFQVNRFLVESLVEAATGDAGGASALDLYAGVGLFALALARRFGEVTAVEAAASAARDLEFNAARAGRVVNTVHARVENVLANLGQAPDFVIADPPRAGLGKGVVSHLLRLGPPDLTIVSCDPSTLSRDLAGLLAGGYRIERLTLIDLFPQTFHIETIVRLKRM